VTKPTDPSPANADPYDPPVYPAAPLIPDVRRRRWSLHIALFLWVVPWPVGLIEALISSDPRAVIFIPLVAHVGWLALFRNVQYALIVWAPIEVAVAALFFWLYRRGRRGHWSLSVAILVYAGINAVAVIARIFSAMSGGH